MCPDGWMDEMTEATPKANPVWHLYVPKLVTLLRRGYGLKDFQCDLVAGLTVAIVALPLAMALAIAFFSRFAAYAHHLGDFNAWSVCMALCTVAIIILLRRWRPTWPGFLIAVAGATLICVAFGIHTETIGTGLPQTFRRR
jgi:MFS superfamily sulfate permease-like transporter